MKEEIIKKLVKKYNLPAYHIEIVIESPFRFMTENLEKRSLGGFRLKHFGKIIIPAAKKQWLIDNNKVQEALMYDEQRKQDKLDLKRMETDSMGEQGNRTYSSEETTDM